MANITRGPLLGSFEENVLNNRLEPIRTIDDGYRAEVRASSRAFCPPAYKCAVKVNYFATGDGGFPLAAQIKLSSRGYRIPRKGTLQVCLFNSLGTVVKMFLILYDLSDMPGNCQTFVRQRTCLEPVAVEVGVEEEKEQQQQQQHANTNNTTQTTNQQQPLLQQQDKANTQQATGATSDTQSNCDSVNSNTFNNKRSNASYMIQLNIVSSKSGQIYLKNDLRVFISRKCDFEAAAAVAVAAAASLNGCATAASVCGKNSLVNNHKNHEQSALQSTGFELKLYDEMPRNPKYFAR